MTTFSDIHQLTEQQSLVVDSSSSAIVVVAGAGSGKTEVVARRVERLLASSPDEAFRVLALSYTVKAADELTERFALRLGSLRERVDATTVHGFAHQLIRQHGTKIGLPVEPEVLARDEDRVELLVQWLTDEDKSVPEQPIELLRALDLERANSGAIRSAALADWNAALNSAGALDYSSLLERATELLRVGTVRRQLARIYRHVCIDEAQNLTPAQYAFLTALVGSPGESHLATMLVGDDKQSIVSFAGADPGLMAQFADEYSADRFELTQNFRSAHAIIELGRAIATKLSPKSSPGSDPGEYAAAGSIDVYEADDEAQEGQRVAQWALSLIRNGLPEAALAPGESRNVAAEDIAVLARSAASLSQTRAALEQAGHTPAISSTEDDWLSTAGGRLALELIALRSAADHRSTYWHLAELLGASESVVRDPAMLQDALRTHADETVRAVSTVAAAQSPAAFIANLAKSSLSRDAPAEEAANYEADCKQLVDTWQAFTNRTDSPEQTWGNLRLFVARAQRGDETSGGVRLLTVHKAQGREYRAVAIVGLNDGQFPDFRAKTEEARLAELRTFYVATTRPRRVLLLTRARSRSTRYGKRSTEPSPYLAAARRFVTPNQVRQ